MSDEQVRKSNAARWRKVGEVMNAARKMPPREPVDVGNFFDRPRPSAWRWIAPAMIAAAFFAIAAWESTGATFGHGFSCALGIVWGVERISDAVKAWRDGR